MPALRDQPIGAVNATRATYLTDGTHLYEVASRLTVQNAGHGGGTISYIIIRDAVSEAAGAVDGLQLAALSDVR